MRYIRLRAVFEMEKSWLRDVEFSVVDEAFRRDVWMVLSEALPSGLRRKVDNGFELQRDDTMILDRILHAKGWAVPNWLAKHGGLEHGVIGHHAVDDPHTDASLALS
jgi:hypothetical protein